MTWWRAPLDHLHGRMEVNVFDFEGVVPFAYTLFAVGLVLGGLAPNMGVLVAARAVQGVGAGAIPAVAYVAIFPSIGAYICWNRGIELIGANRSGVFLHLVPLYSALMATVFLGEHLRLYHVLGFVLILTGVHVTTRAPR